MLATHDLLTGYLVSISMCCERSFELLSQHTPSYDDTYHSLNQGYSGNGKTPSAPLALRKSA